MFKIAAILIICLNFLLINVVRGGGNEFMFFEKDVTSQPHLYHHLKWITNGTFFPLDLRIPIDQSKINDTQMWDWMRLSDHKLISKLPDYPRNYLVTETSNRATLMILNYDANTHEELSSYEPKLTEVSTPTSGGEKIVILNNQDGLAASDSNRRDVFTLVYLKNHYINYKKLSERIKVWCVADFLVSNANSSILETTMHLMERYASFKLTTRSASVKNYKNSRTDSPHELFIGKKRPTAEEKLHYQRQFNSPSQESTQNVQYSLQNSQQRQSPPQQPIPPIQHQQLMPPVQPQQPIPPIQPQQQPQQQQQQQKQHFFAPQQIPIQAHQFQQQNIFHPQQQPHDQMHHQQAQYYPVQSVQSYQMSYGPAQVAYSPYMQIVSDNILPISITEYDQFRHDISNFYSSYVNPVRVVPQRALRSRTRNYFAPIDEHMRLKRSPVSIEKRDVVKSSLDSANDGASDDHDEDDEQLDYDHKKFVKVRLSLGPISIYKPYEREEKVTCELNLINMESQISDYLNKIQETIVTGGDATKQQHSQEQTTSQTKSTSDSGLLFFFDKPGKEVDDDQQSTTSDSGLLFFIDKPGQGETNKAASSNVGRIQKMSTVKSNARSTYATFKQIFNVLFVSLLVSILTI